MIGPRAVIPRHVAACQHSPTSRERWFTWIWKRAHPGVQSRVPYNCNSWRCPVCRRHEAAVAFARIRQAQQAIDAAGWCLIVLTVDRLGFYSGKPWFDVNACYRSLSKMSSKFLREVGYRWGPDTKLERYGGGKVRTVRHLSNRWIATVEAHRSGWPHVNVMVWCPALALYLARQRDERLSDPEVANAVALLREAWKPGSAQKTAQKEPIAAEIYAKGRQASLVSDELAELVQAAGWGLQSTAEAARSTEAVAGYIIKVAAHHDASVGELAKITQAPTNAPARFRRLRSGRRFLPPRHKNPDVTGCLIRRRRSAQGDQEIIAVNASKDDTQREPIELALRAEQALIFEEEAILCRTRGNPPPMPPVRVAFEGELEGHRETSERAAALRSRELSACG